MVQPFFQSPAFIWYPLSLADVASILGIVVGLFGFILTLYQLSKVRTAAESADQAVNQVKGEILRINAVQDLTRAQGLLREIKTASRDSTTHHILPDRCEFEIAARTTTAHFPFWETRSVISRFANSL
jgi:hypothetical protein